MVEYVLIDGAWYPLDVDERIKDIYEINTDGDIRNKETGKLLSPYIDKDGYEKMTMSSKTQGKKIHQFKHRLVAKKFIPGDESLQVNHIDADKHNNHYSNLEWCTNKENIQHSINNHLQEFVKGSSHPASIFSEEDVETLCEYIVQGYTNKEIYEFVKDDFNNFTKDQIKGVLKGIRSKKKWRHVSKKYF